MRTILILLCFISLAATSQTIDTIAANKTTTDTTVTITYKILHTYVLKKTDFTEQIIRLSEDSARITQDKANWLANFSKEMIRVRSEKRRLTNLLK